MNLNSNWLKDLRTELFKRMYEKPIHPKNLWLENDPLQHQAVDEIYRQNIETLVERGTWTRPTFEHEGCRFQPGGDEEPSWQEMKKMWSTWDEQ